MAAVRKVRPPKFNDTTGAIRALAMDAVQKANSGHPGAPVVSLNLGGLTLRTAAIFTCLLSTH